MIEHVDGWKDEEMDTDDSPKVWQEGTYEHIKDEKVPAYIFGPSKYDPSEPIFILRGKDILAWQAVDHWIRLAEHANVNDVKLNGARRIRDNMRKWAVRVPD